jgi:hypothetical protein
VVCVPLSPILEKILQVPHINLLVLDLEGAEYLVLEELFRSTSASGEEGAGAGAGRRLRVDLAHIQSIPSEASCGEKRRLSCPVAIAGQPLEVSE